ncbi:copper resistance protein B, partial [Novacetimonas hansenii]|nr:copper resistance protein B [Novacetimonas hansenii]
MLSVLPIPALAQAVTGTTYHAADAATSTPVVYLGGMKPVMDQASYFHGILDEFEGRYAPG